MVGLFSSEADAKLAAVGLAAADGTGLTTWRAADWVGAGAGWAVADALDGSCRYTLTGGGRAA